MNTKQDEQDFTKMNLFFLEQAILQMRYHQFLNLCVLCSACSIQCVHRPPAALKTKRECSNFADFSTWNIYSIIRACRATLTFLNAGESLSCS